MSKVFHVRFDGEITIELSDAVLAQVDNEWRKNFYSNIRTPEDIVEHIAYNIVINRWNLSALDGFANLSDDNVTILETPDWDVNAIEED